MALEREQESLTVHVEPGACVLQGTHMAAGLACLPHLGCQTNGQQAGMHAYTHLHQLPACDTHACYYCHAPPMQA